MAPLREVLQEIHDRIARYKGRRLNEENTKATLVDPVLRALGWDLEDLEDVQREYKVKRRDKPVDYALFSGREPVLFVEAKALGEDLNDRRWANQIMGYATVAGVPWIVLTNGNEYRIFNAHAAVPVERKLFRSISIAIAPEEAIETLGLLEKARMADRDLEKLWQAHFVDQEVRAVVEDLLGAGVPDPSLVSLVRRRTKGLSPRDVRASLTRMRVALDFPVETIPAKRPASRKGPQDKKIREPPDRQAVAVADLITAGILQPPLKLLRRYKGSELSATIERGGRITFQGTEYDSLSTAAGMARKTVIGAPRGRKYPQTNGWTFWQFQDQNGQLKQIDELRQQYVRRRGLKLVG